MARSSYIQLTTTQEEAYYGALQSSDRFINPAIRKKINLLSVRRKKGISARSLLATCAEVWKNFSQLERDAWNTAGTYSYMSGWKLFVKDYCYRIKNDIAGVATPNNYHQALVGRLYIGSPDTELKIIQPHPYAYYISKKVTGKKGMFIPHLVQERLALPFTIGLSYKSDLVAVGDDAFAKFYAVVRRLYQGQNIDYIVEIPLDFQTDWKTDSAVLSALVTSFTSYSLYFHLYNVQGNVYIDNIKSKHTGANWARDQFCNDINQGFTRAFYQVPKHWVSITLPENAFYESVYPED
jgi:hypothetical protein